jgi:hypothetical protein
MTDQIYTANGSHSFYRDALLCAVGPMTPERKQAELRLEQHCKIVGCPDLKTLLEGLGMEQPPSCA